MARRSNGEGSVCKRTDGRWCASRYVDCGNGKFKRKYVYGKTQKEVKEKLNNVELINGISFLCVSVNHLSQASAKQLVYEYQNQLNSGVICLVNIEEDKATYYVCVSQDLNQKGIKAGDLVKVACQVSNGRGGGKPDFAQGGTKELSLVNQGIEAIKKQL